MISEQSQESALSTVKNVAQNLKKKGKRIKKKLKVGDREWASIALLIRVINSRRGNYFILILCLITKVVHLMKKILKSAHER